jgi:hypothetical protein
MSELIGAELDAAVAAALGRPLPTDWNRYGNDPAYMRASCYEMNKLLGDWFEEGEDGMRDFAPSLDWGCGGPIIEDERIELVPHDDGKWFACYPEKWKAFGPTPLIAAMRAFVASKT